MSKRLEQYIEQVRDQMEGQRAGLFSSVFRGSGMEIADFRQRQPGDQQKAVNRRLSAKHDALWVNQYEADRTMDVELFLDINQNRAAGDRKENVDIVIAMLTDFLVYAKKRQLRCSISWRHRGVYRVWHRRYDVQQVMHIFQTLLADVEEMKRLRNSAGFLRSASMEYVSHLYRYLQRAGEERKRRVCVLWSDFLGWTEQETLLATYLREQHTILVGIRLPVSENIGANYDGRTRDVSAVDANPPIAMVELGIS